MTRSSITGSAPVGKYALEVSAYAGSLAQFGSTPSRAGKAQARKNAAALRAALAEPEEPREPLEAVEKLEDTADAVTDRVEHANKLFKALAEDRLFDRNLLTGETGALLGLLDRLDREGRYDEEIRLAKALHGVCVLAFRWLDLVRSLRSALAAARAAGNEAAQAWALNELGALHLCAGDPKKAEEYLDRALELQETLGDAAGRCATRHNLDNARRDIARPVQIGAPRRLIALGGVVAALALFAAGGAALGAITGGSAAADAPTVTLTVEARGEGGGSVFGRGIDCGIDCTEEFADGTTVTLTAAADESAFVRWRGVDCEGGSGDETCTLRVEGDVTAVAVFAKHRATTWTLSVKTTGGGSVFGRGIDCGIDCTEEFADGTTVTLTAAADNGWDFYEWQDVACDEGSQLGATCTFSIKADVQVVAPFDPYPG
jgi:tetratricopeptide (TPR) repeat protein